MSTFQHSIVLFSGDDGLPLEFNVRNTNEKALLKAMIEHGGGLCSQSQTAVHLITPGTKVLNADLGKNLVSSRYIFDCVNKNYLLDVNEYVFTISEAETSDISEEGSIRNMQDNPHENSKELSMDLDISDKELSNTPDLSAKSKTHDTTTTSESFIEGTFENNPNSKTVSYKSKRGFESPPFASTAKDPLCNPAPNDIDMDLSPIQGSASLVSPVLRKKSGGIVHSQAHVPEKSPVHIVSSSQEAIGDLDPFDNLILNKIQTKNQSDQEECLSQSYTVSSSADAQLGSKPNSSEILDAAAIPDSPVSNAMTDSHLFLKNLEAEVEKVLQKPSPKSIQDKICLLKYVCYVKKLSPATVLQSLHSL